MRNKIFKSRDAQIYYQLICNAGYSEGFAYKLNTLFDRLEFSAAEMWIGPEELKRWSVSQSEIDSILKTLPKNIKKESYYSEKLTKTLFKIYNKIKAKCDKTNLEYHLYQSISKELFCYRSSLVQKLNLK